MISLNLNAIHEWERVRSDTTPHTPNVDRNPGAENPDRPELDNGSHGLLIIRRRQHDRHGDEQTEEPEHEANDAYEVTIGEDEGGLAPPPDGSRAPNEPYQGQNVDLEA